MIDASPWVDRPHRGPRAEAFALTEEERLGVENAIRPAKTEKRIAVRGQALLLMADGVSAEDVAQILGVHPRTAWKWKQRFAAADDLVAALADAPRSGRPRSLSRMRLQRA